MLKADVVTEQVQARLPASLRPLGAALTRTVARRHPYGLPEVPATRAAVLAEGVRLIAGRSRGELALRVYTPDEHGGTMIAVVVEDAPFLLSTIAGELDRMRLTMANHAYPEFGVVRDDDGVIRQLRPARGAEERQTWIHVELTRRLEPAQVEEVATALRAVLADVQLATGDFDRMRERAAQIAEGLAGAAGADEAAAFVRWLLDDHFVFLGAVDHGLTPDGDVAMLDDSALGVMRSDRTGDGRAGRVGPPQVPQEGALAVSLTHKRSTVHRHERMMDVVALVEHDGRRTLRRLVGLFARKAASEQVTTIPLLRGWVERVAAAEDIVTESHDERMLRSTLEALPKDALFTADTERLRAVFDALVRDERGTVRLVAWAHPPSAAATIVVALSRSRFDVRLRERIDELIARRLETEPVTPFVGFHEHEALLTYVVELDPRRTAVRLEDVATQLRAEIRTLSQTWAERVAGVAAAQGVEEAVTPWVGRLPASYRDTVDPVEAVADCRQLAELAAGDVDVRMRVLTADRSPAAGSQSSLRVKLYRRGPVVELSRFVPILESLGLVVIESVPHVLRDGGDDTTPYRIHDYGVRLELDADFHIDDDGRRLAGAAEAIWAGAAEADSLNRLVLLAGLHWRDVAVLRAYRQFRRQVGTTFTAQYQNDALCDYPEVARALMEYFVARFRPGIAEPQERIEDARAWLLHTLDDVARLDQDRILRGYLELIDATVRTNRYRSPRPYQIALKLDSNRIPALPKPVPFREIFVYSPQMEGIHLRGGPIARGGLRWSDRLEDFRTETLDLMKAQMVKNAVIVPTGSKGGFVLKRGVAAADVREEVQRQYEWFIRGLLDVTDNIVDGEVRHPEGVRCHDGDDAYLVVAADRGTAALSDVANAISEQYGFWLADAFASGGSQGYDHKAMGITARGAWVAVRQHFRELDIDVQREPITVLGIGDMSGDVFGNGMLQSRALKLIAAFDHRDVFVDPDPDPERSYEERRRLFELPGATWQDYDRDLLSDGGGVWSRSVKRIELSKQVRGLVRTDRETMTPPELIQALLRAPVDLLFAGGIGTFIKASSEHNTDVGDRANDAVRVDAGEIGARVIGEGGNLAITQRGRMQYARRGGRINLDAIDNAAGVDTSDREVNLKILLGQAIDAGALAPEDRDALLAEVTDDIAAGVLEDIAAQTRLISQESTYSPSELDAHEQLMVDLEASGRLDRAVEALPDSEEIQRRTQAGGGLTRPELGLLLGYAKADLAARLTDSRLPRQAALRVLLDQYFPAAIAERFPDLIQSHRLRDELVATRLANDLINQLGITTVSRTVHQLGCGAPQVAGAYWIAREVSGAAEDWAQIDDLVDRLDPGLQFRMKQPVDRLVDTYTRLYASRRLPDDLREVIDRDRRAFVLLQDVWPSDPPPGVAAQRRELVADVVARGVDEALALRLVARPDLAYIPDVSAVAADRDRPVEQVASAFVEVGRELPLEQLQESIERIAPEGRWQQWEHKTLLDELHSIRRLATRQALDAHPDAEGDMAVRRLFDDRTMQLERVWALLATIGEKETPDLAQAAVTMSALRSVLG
ncbi:MAG TPA: NAD-glutamate dehydrogenase domain-containing protein [Euzebyales bacterium]|nr:NAD-glutamate dehydrogenase domain-containing protein [Euzebyales bacterium]